MATFIHEKSRFCHESTQSASQCRRVLVNNLKSRALEFLSMYATLDKGLAISKYLTVVRSKCQQNKTYFLISYGLNCFFFPPRLIFFVCLMFGVGQVVKSDKT